MPLVSLEVVYFNVHLLTELRQLSSPHMPLLSSRKSFPRNLILYSDTLDLVRHFPGAVCELFAASYQPACPKTWPSF